MNYDARIASRNDRYTLSENHLMNAIQALPLPLRRMSVKLPE